MVPLLAELHITVLSSAVFTNVVFPISILNKIHGLETVIFEKDTKFVFDELKDLKYLYAYQMYPKSACKVCGNIERYQKPLKNLLWVKEKYAIVKERFFIVFQIQKKKWIEDFERDYCYDKCIRLARSPPFSWVNLTHTPLIDWLIYN